MTLDELLPMLHALPPADKLRAIQVMAADVAGEFGGEQIDPSKSYSIWSPYDAFEGAATLLNILDQEETVS